jgi:hypothetical protein
MEILYHREVIEEMAKRNKDHGYLAERCNRPVDAALEARSEEWKPGCRSIPGASQHDMPVGR